MAIEFIGVRHDPSFPDQFFEITINRDAPLPDICQVVIERPGQEEPYLASRGWQANYTHIEISLRQDETTLKGLRLSQKLLRFFEAGYNYKISLVDLEGRDLGFLVIGWNPTEQFLNPPSPAGRGNVTQPVLEAELENAPERQPLAEQLPEQEEKPVQEPEPTPIPEPKVLPKPKLPPGSESTPKPKAMSDPNPIRIAPREVIRCRNKKCGGEIFSTFVACPYCGSTILG